MRLVDNRKKVLFSTFVFSVFLFPIYFFISYSLFLRRKKKRETNRVEEKEEGFPPGPVSLYKK